MVRQARNDYLAAYMMSHLSDMPAPIRQALQEGSAKIVPAIKYVVKQVSTLTRKDFFEDSDSKSVGVTNLNKGAFELGEHFVLGSIRLLGAVATTHSGGAAVRAGATYTIADRRILNGEISLEVGTGNIILPKMSANCFDTTTVTERQVGEYVLDTPKLLPIGQRVAFIADFAAAAGTFYNARVELIGVQIAKG
jgi:hypothetical protein